jgi:CheY-like chemotaxis protein
MTPRVLIVDDEPHLLRLLVRVLERAGLEVVGVADGTAAIDALAPGRPDFAAVVLDVHVPPRGAGEVLDALDTPGTAEARPGLVVVSGEDPGPALRARIEADGGCFLRKPFLPDALLDTVRGVLRDPPGAAG